jgi:hypothetical protein
VQGDDVSAPAGAEHHCRAAAARPSRDALAASSRHEEGANARETVTSSACMQAVASPSSATRKARCAQQRAQRLHAVSQNAACRVL